MNMNTVFNIWVTFSYIADGKLKMHYQSNASLGTLCTTVNIQGMYMTHKCTLGLVMQKKK